MAGPRRAFLDRPIARLIALVIALLCLGALAWLHRADLFPGIAAAVGADDPFTRCLAERAAEIDKMVAEGLIDDRRARLFKSRAEGLCRTQSASP